VIQAVNRILVPEPIEHSVAALVVMCVAIACAIGLILYERNVVTATGSLAVEADQTHYFADLVTNIGVVLALLLSSGPGLDPGRSPDRHRSVRRDAVVGAGRGPPGLFNQLMDRELPDEERARICRIAQATGRSRMCMTSRRGWRGFPLSIQLHLALDPEISLAEAHGISGTRWSVRCWKPIPART